MPHRVTSKQYTRAITGTRTARLCSTISLASCTLTHSPYLPWHLRTSSSSSCSSSPRRSHGRPRGSRRLRSSTSSTTTLLHRRRRLLSPARRRSSRRRRPVTARVRRSRRSVTAGGRRRRGSTTAARRAADSSGSCPGPTRRPEGSCIPGCCSALSLLHYILYGGTSRSLISLRSIYVCTTSMKLLR